MVENRNLRHYLGMTISLFEEVLDDFMSEENEKKVIDLLRRVKSGSDVRREEPICH